MYQSLVISFMDWDGLSANIRFVGLENYRTHLFRGRYGPPGVAQQHPVDARDAADPDYDRPAAGRGAGPQAARPQCAPRDFYGPAVLPLVAVGMIWAWMYNPQFGFINVFLRSIGLGQFARGWLSLYETALPATFVTAISGGIGFPMVLYLAALQAIPAEQYEAAKMDGANGAPTLLQDNPALAP